MPSKSEVFAILTKLADMYPRFELKDATTDAYYDMLADIPLDELRAAAAVCATSSPFYPSLYELRAAVASLRMKSQHVPTANEAFIEVSLAKPHHDWSHPVVKKIAYEMGWQHSIFPTDNTVADRSQFIKAYEAAVNELVWNETIIPGVMTYIESSRIPALRDPQVSLSHATQGYDYSDDSIYHAKEDYKNLREALGSETVAEVAERLKAKVRTA